MAQNPQNDIKMDLQKNLFVQDCILSVETFMLQSSWEFSQCDDAQEWCAINFTFTRSKVKIGEKVSADVNNGLLKMLKTKAWIYLSKKLARLLSYAPLLL